jgi:molybdate transport system substrate-binding protein
MRALRVLAAVLAGLMPLAACGSDGPASGATSTTGAGRISGSVTVLAAASLRAAFAEVAAGFEAAHPGVTVVLSFDGSARLATAIVEGAPADVFAAADEATMETVVRAGRTEGTPTVFATNVLEIVVPAGNPRRVGGLVDLARGDLRVSLCRPEVPCGRYAARAFEEAGLVVPQGGDQDSVTGVLSQVLLGEADAGIVYRTDVRAADRVEGIELPDPTTVRAVYRAARLVDAPNPVVADAFVHFLRSAAAQVALRERGFGSVPRGGTA